MFSASSFDWRADTIFAIGAMAIPIIAIIAGVWHKVTVSTSENELKRAMVQRGMSVEEIERVMAAGTRQRK